MLPPPPPPLQTTCHYIVNFYVKLWHVRLGGANSMRPLSWGGGAQTEKIQTFELSASKFQWPMKSYPGSSKSLIYLYNFFRCCTTGTCNIQNCQLCWNKSKCWFLCTKEGRGNGSLFTVTKEDFWRKSHKIVKCCQRKTVGKGYYITLKHSRAHFKMPNIRGARSQNARSFYLARSWISLTFVILKRARFVF